MSGPAPDAPPVRNRFVVGLDLGRQVDYSALAVLQWHQPDAPRPVAFAPLPGRPPPPVYEVPTLYRWPLGTSYLAVAEGVARFLKAPPLCAGRTVLVVDETGVGAAVYEVLVKQLVEAGVRGSPAA